MTVLFKTKILCLGWTADVNDRSPWIMVDLERTQVIKGIITRGKRDVDEWVTLYTIGNHFYTDIETFLT